MRFLLSLVSWIWTRRPLYTLTVVVHGDGWGWHAKAGNGEIIAQGEGYTRRADAERAARHLCAARLVFKEPFA